jgi:hypothetical protein
MHIRKAEYFVQVKEMSRRARRSATSLSYNLQKAYRRIMAIKPSTFLLATLAIATSIFLLGGGIYDIIEQPAVAFVGAGGRIIPYYPQALNEQLVAESVASMILYSFGTMGLVLVYQSTKYAYNPREAFTMLLLGLLLFLIGWVVIEFYLFPSTIAPLR